MPTDRKYRRLIRSAMNPDANIANAYAKRKEESNVPKSVEESASEPSVEKNVITK